MTEERANFRPLEELFQTIPPEVPAVNQEWAKILDWDTTPKDLRAPEVKTLKQFSEHTGIKVHRINRIRQEETYLRARRQMAQDRGMLNHQCFLILEVLYEQCLAGNVAAIKEWRSFYPDEMLATAHKATMKPGNLTEDVGSVEIEDLDTAKIEELLANMD